MSQNKHQTNLLENSTSNSQYENLEISPVLSSKLKNSLNLQKLRALNEVDPNMEKNSSYEENFLENKSPKHGMTLDIKSAGAKKRPNSDKSKSRKRSKGETIDNSQKEKQYNNLQDYEDLLDSDSQYTENFESLDSSVTLYTSNDESDWSICDWDSPIADENIVTSSSDEEPAREVSQDYSVGHESPRLEGTLGHWFPNNISPIVNCNDSPKKIENLDEINENSELPKSGDFPPCSQLNYVQWLPLSADSDKENLNPDDWTDKDINSVFVGSPRIFLSLPNRLKPKPVFDD